MFRCREIEQMRKLYDVVMMEFGARFGTATDDVIKAINKTGEDVNKIAAALLELEGYLPRGTYCKEENIDFCRFFLMARESMGIAAMYLAEAIKQEDWRNVE